ncbi:DUF2274 domain-containing protein [Sphingomonas immobilis]|uniref:DUF2274 domain-containing protein n=1 Tax=Sphingomonas immobilis TaxID=3063997 RepID=A0ABT9A123_9SPHN|nr:DUF2274 domain-containing protein [Sphingomonas sp. CA1-15]MDO7843538.1 DUF2274 domain-containing protein [Sphingomonas sp. CA1-15]
MTELKLPRLPNRVPVKLTVQITPQLHADLSRYAALYKETYGAEEAVVDLIPSMLSTFLESDRTFIRNRGGPK